MRIAVVGNCHADIVAQSVRRALAGMPDLDCRHIVSYKTATSDDQDFVRKADRVLAQVANFKRAGNVADVASRAGEAGLFPLIAANFLYPFAGRAHPRAADSRSVFCPSGYYEGQVSCGALIDLMKAHAGEPDAAVVDRYMALDFAVMIDLDRLYDMNRTKMQRIGAAAGLDLWPLVERGFRDRPMFWSYLHPTGEMMRAVCRHALGQLRLGLATQTILAAAEAVQEPFSFAHMVLHPSVVRHFGIDWAHPGYRYRFMPEGGFTARQFAERFVGFVHNDALNQAIYNIHSNLQLDDAVATLERARTAITDNGDILINLAVAYLKQGRLAQSLEAAVAALETDPRQADWASFVCMVARLSGVAAPVLSA